MKLQKYEKYKDSGVEWLGEIPEEWEVKKLKYVVNMIRTGTTPSTQNPNFFDGNIDWFNPKDLNQSMLKNAEKKVSNLAIERKEIKLFPANSILIVGIGATTGKTAYLAKNATFNQQITGFKSFTHKNKFLFYLLKNSSKIFLKIANYTTLPILNNEFFKSYILPIPPLHEQTKIADFLDQKTAQIDKAISLKEQLIEKLKEYRQILINNAVTKGEIRKANDNCLSFVGSEPKSMCDSTDDGDYHIKMKDSGVKWIGEVPEHWEVKKFRYLFSFSKGLNITKENLQEKGIPCVNYGEIHSKYGFEVDPLKHPLKCVNEEYLETSQKSLLKKGDFVFADTSEDIEGSGNFTCLNSDVPTFAGYHTIITRAKKSFNYRYIAYLFDSEAFRNQIRNRVKGVKVYSITNAILKDMLICLPTNTEQQNIVKYLNNQTQKIDKAISQQQKQIEKLKEYKASLIDSVVTGKVRVS